MLTKTILLIFLKISLSLTACTYGEKHCSRCNPVTKLCVKCDKNIYVPDKKGGCENSHKCIVGENQCLECDGSEKLCAQCVEGYFPDENGGCSYTDNCEVSYQGECLKCKENFILIGEKSYYSNYEDRKLKICKSMRDGDLKNCEEINKSNGLCEKCVEGYYLNSGDKRCSKIENCYESTFDVCKKCIRNHYLDRKVSKCKNQTEEFEHCKESLDGKTCDACEDDYYFDEEGKCIAVNFCSESRNEYQCEKCAEGYFPSFYGTSCVTTKHCYYGEPNIGICTSCDKGYYIDFKDGKCKSNSEDNDFKFCRIAEGNACLECTNKFELSEDKKCSSTKNCAESENGKCVACLDNYYLGLDNMCTNIKHCIYSNDYNCLECEDEYYYDEETKKCVRGEDEFENCKSGNSSSVCDICKDDYYLNQEDNLCHSNKKEGKFYKCAKTDLNGEYCTECIDGYYLGEKDNKCSKVEGCVLSENEKKCLECDLYYCLDEKTGKCEYNDVIEDEEKKFYFRCNKTNEEGNACEVCEEGYTLNKKGLCVDEEHCVKKDEDDKCIKCQNDEEGVFCLNKDFGCVEIYYNNNCLQCNNILDFHNCTKCFDGYELDDNKDCYKSD